MILAVDVGNTHIVIGYIEKDEIKSIARMTTDIKKTEHEYAAVMKHIMEFDGIDPKSFEGVIISTVVPPLMRTLKNSIKLLTGLEPIVIGAGIKTGLDIKIDNPAQLGGDLVTGAVAALSLYKPPLIIIDMGTATTISVIDKNGSFIGGPIIPGVAVSLSALSGDTSLLPQIPIEAPERCIGRNTIESMKSGAVFGAASMLDGMIDRIEEELNSEARLIATGGIATSIIPYCKHKIEYDEYLLLRGLNVIYKKNSKK